MRRLLLLISFHFLGCASATPQADTLLMHVTPTKASSVIDGVPYVEQKAGHCGPATLTMALLWAGKNVHVDEVVSLVYTPGMKGSFQTDMMSATRRLGMTAIPIRGFADLIQELNVGHPVIVFENLALSWLPQWHYAIVFGYDLSNQSVMMHSGSEAFKKWDLRKFERSWSLGDYWGLVVLPSDQLSASGSELEHSANAASLEQIGQTEAASRAYQSILKKWPTSLVARIGLANIAFVKKDYVGARNFLRRARNEHPASAVAWHNSVFAEAALGEEREARRSARAAMLLAPPEVRSRYAVSLKEWLE